VSNSKYRNKQKQKPQVFKRPEIVFNYACTCHGLRAEKKACAKGNGEMDDKGFFQSPLGTWNCSVTKRACKVQRTRKLVVPVEDASLYNTANDVIPGTEALSASV
jgi:hypothetical protein